ncbi:DUF547 domain-containing protein [Oscillatoria sp. FACHB-1407]|uniref:DUF547 domain-containing protein n=1 Tax=Oscillatoria sp. FACHB-1407 TaxID=2692847 RepID=UPI001686C589|nr:DUF547 domain-containing protein [Oscillatoria sp. FACHB-1407]MBD2461299.1 DUF547 domain-containing protein [Oscillatoria sp. FACHB-1407]
MQYDTWNQLLHRYVDSQGRVNYTAWKEESVEILDQWLIEIRSTQLIELTTTEQRLALWLNLYNALVIAQVLAFYPIATIRPTIFGIPDWISFFRFFSRPLYQLDGTRYSLNAIEHGTLRKEFTEPRIHFALVCAAIGCPLLRAEAYEPERVYAQLEEDAQRFITNSYKVRYDAQTQTLHCSQIFKWYKADFLKVAPSLTAYIQRYLLTVTMPDVTRVRYLPYDWRLNQRNNQRHLLK